MDLVKLRDAARRLIAMIDEKDNWIGTMAGHMVFHGVLDEIRWHIDGKESEVLRETGRIQQFRKPEPDLEGRLATGADFPS